MTAGDGSSLTYGLLCLILVASSLFARRLPLGPTLKMTLAWIGIFAFVYVLFLFRPEFMSIWERAKADVAGGAVSKDGQVVVRKSSDGHFYIDGAVNGHRLHFLVDSGATVTTLTEIAAKNAKVEIDPGDFPVMVNTANGVASERRARVKELKVGSIARQDFPIHVSEGLGETNVIGMNFLSTLAGWRVAGEEMILNP